MINYPFRYSKNIEKQILWYLLAYLISNKKFINILDVGCGLGQNIRFLTFENYTGLDIDEERININKKKYISQNYNFYKHDITKDIFKTEINFDIILFIQVLTNSLFKKDEVSIALNNLIKMTNKKFIFNTSFKNKDKIKDIEILLSDSKIDYIKIKYGINKFFKKIKIPIISQVIALIYLILALKQSRLINNDKILYLCEKR